MRNSLPWTILLLWLAFLGLEGTARLAGLYRTVPPIDLPIHVLAGAALSATWIFIARLRHRRRKRSSLSSPPPWRIRTVAVLGAVAVSVLWEVGEIIEERVRVNPPHLLDPFFWDGVLDLLAALVGAAMVSWPLVSGRRTESKPVGP